MGAHASCCSADGPTSPPVERTTSDRSQSAADEAVAARRGRQALLATLETSPAEEDDSQAQQREELSRQPVRELRKRAAAGGGTEDAVEECLDSAAPKRALVQLVLELESRRRGCLEAELAALPPRELRRRAAGAGATSDEIDDALDEEDSKAALTRLVLTHQSAAPADSAGHEDKPHFGVPLAAAEPAAPAAWADRLCSLRKHVMLSYDWSVQEEVVAAKEALTAAGIPVWMDINGGMERDIFDSMAEGVQEAAVIVPFMTSRYQASENCSLELKFARQWGVEIVPVMMEQDWKPSGWLGILTAGLLYTPLYNDQARAENTDKLIYQIRLAAESMDSLGDEDTSDAELADTKAELQRLQQRLAHSHPAVDSGESGAVEGADKATRLPAQVPPLPPFIITTDEMKKAELLLTEKGHRRTVVVVGMGGIGKTMFCAWLCHQEAVRTEFESVCFVTIGQEYDIDQVLRLVYLQVQGQELPSDLPTDQAKEYIKIAMAGKDVLLVIDDAWDKQVLEKLQVVDENSSSKILVSTRVRLVDDAEIIEAQLPSDDDAVTLLLGAAEMKIDGQPPAEAAQLVKMCKRLPLALGICGKILKDLSLREADSWQGVIGVVEDVMREDVKLEESVIVASLKSIPEEAQQLFYSLGLSAEDAALPLEVIVVLHEASLVGRGLSSTRPMTILRARRLIKILIDFSLVTGSVDRFYLHDIVLDHARSIFSEEQSQAAHTAVVERLRQARPTEVNGWEFVDHPLASYVKTQIVYHMRAALGSSLEDGSWQTNDVATSWMTKGCNGVIDVIARAAGSVFGVENTAQLAKTAETGGDFWVASVRWVVAAQTLKDTVGRAPEMYSTLETAVATIQRVTVGEVSQTERDRLELRAVVGLITSWNLVLVTQYGAHLQRLGALASEDPVLHYLVEFISIVVKHWFPGDIPGWSKGLWDLHLLCRDAVETIDDSRKSLILSMANAYPFMANHITLVAELDGFEWEEIRDTMKQSNELYAFSSHHRSVIDIATADGNVMGCTVWTAVLHWGNLEAASKQFDTIVHSCERIMAELAEGHVASALTAFFTMVTLPFSLLAIGRRGLAAHFLTQTIGLEPVSLGVAGKDGVEEPALRLLRQAAFPGYNERQATAYCKMLLVLSDDSLTSEQVRQLLMAVPAVPSQFAILSLPNVAEWPPELSKMPMFNLHTYLAPCALAALTFCKLGWDEKAMAFARESLLGDQSRGGDSIASTRIFALAVQGQVSARKAQDSVADAAFDDAATIAQRIGLGLYEILVLHAWKTVASSAPGSDGGVARLEEVQRRWSLACERMESSEQRFAELGEQFWRPIGRAL